MIGETMKPIEPTSKIPNGKFSTTHVIPLKKSLAI